jgi:hypothetical protein
MRVGQLGDVNLFLSSDKIVTINKQEQHTK